MSDQNRNFSHRWFDEVWNKKREAAIDELAHPDARSFGFPSPDAEMDLEGFKQGWREFHANFSDIRVRIDEELVDGDNIAARWTATAKHTGDGLGFAPTNKSVTFSGSSFIRLRDGKLAEGRNFYDFTHVLQSLGAPAVTKAS